MISEDIRRQFAQLRRDTGTECYVVRVFSPEIVLALVIPAGAKGKETLNPENIDVDLVGEQSCDDWGEVMRPVLTVFKAKKDDGPRLRVVPSGDAA
jgi:hypothetical protein